MKDRKGTGNLCENELPIRTLGVREVMLAGERELCVTTGTLCGQVKQIGTFSVDRSVALSCIRKVSLGHHMADRLRGRHDVSHCETFILLHLVLKVKTEDCVPDYISVL